MGYSIVHPVFMSFYSKSLYQYVGRNWKGISFVYLLLLLAICWIPGMIQLHSVIADFVTYRAPDIVEQIPPITISHGEVSIDRPQPYFIKDPEYGALMIIDTTGQFTSLDESEATVLLTKTKLIARKSEKETRVFDLSQIDDLLIDQSLVNIWLEAFRDWFAIVTYPFLVLFTYLYRIVQALVYAAIGIAMTKMLRTTLTYQSLISLAIVAITPALVLDTIVSFMNASVPLWNVICFVIAMGYLFYAVKANAEIVIAGPSGFVP